MCSKQQEKPGIPPFLNDVGKFVIHHESGQPPYKDREKYLAFDAQERNGLELADVRQIHLLRYNALFWDDGNMTFADILCNSLSI